MASIWQNMSWPFSWRASSRIQLQPAVVSAEPTVQLVQLRRAVSGAHTLLELSVASNRHLEDTVIENVMTTVSDLGDLTQGHSPRPTRLGHPHQAAIWPNYPQLSHSS
jgi:hypothetical protein